MLLRLKNFNSDLFLTSFPKYYKSYFNAPSYNLFNLDKSNSKLIYWGDRLIGSVLLDFHGDKIDSVDLFYLNNFRQLDISSLIDQLKNSFSLSDTFIIRNITSNRFKDLKNNPNLSYKTKSIKSKKFYPSENTYPHVIYSFSNVKEKFKYEKKRINNITYYQFSGSQFSNYRYSLNRIEKYFPEITSIDLDKIKYREILNNWYKNIAPIIESETNDRYNFLSIKYFKNYWYMPLNHFWDFFDKYRNKFSFAYKCISHLDNKGAWIGTLHNNSLFILIFITDRNNAQFSDALLLSIFGYAIENDISKVFLGGSETESLFRFKSKYVDKFHDSKTEKIYDLIIE